MPDGATATACKLLKGLLNRTPHLRLGSTKSTMFEVGGPAALKKHDFFKQIDWEKLERKEVEPPERLTVQNDTDLKHFHDEYVAYRSSSGHSTRFSILTLASLFACIY